MSARDKLAELRRIAEAATPGPWVHQQGQWAITAPEHDKEHGGCNICGLHDGGQTWASAMANAAHIAAWSPDRALRFVALVEKLDEFLDPTVNEDDDPKCRRRMKDGLRTALAAALEE